MFEVTIRTEPPRRLAVLPHKGPYTEIGRAFEKLGSTIAASGLFPQVREMVGIYHDDPAVVPASELRSHAGFVVPDNLALPDSLEELRLPGGRTAVLRFKGPYSGLPEAYGFLYKQWLPASGETAGDASAMEIYLNMPGDTAAEDLLTDICVPLE